MGGYDRDWHKLTHRTLWRGVPPEFPEIPSVISSQKMWFGSPQEEEFLTCRTRYAGQKPKKALRRNKTPTHPNGVVRPTKTWEIRIKPRMERKQRSVAQILLGITLSTGRSSIRYYKNQPLFWQQKSLVFFFFIEISRKNDGSVWEKELKKMCEWRYVFI